MCVIINSYIRIVKINFEFLMIVFTQYFNGLFNLFNIILH